LDIDEEGQVAVSKNVGLKRVAVSYFGMVDHHARGATHS